MPILDKKVLENVLKYLRGIPECNIECVDFEHARINWSTFKKIAENEISDYDGMFVQRHFIVRGKDWDLVVNNDKYVMVSNDELKITPKDGLPNLLRETEIALHEYGKTPSDVKWVGSEIYGWFTWDDFKKLANRTYDRGLARRVPYDLKIVGDDWWLERSGCNGLECWEYKELPEKPEEYRVPDKIIADDYNYIRPGLWDLEEGDKDG